MRRAGLVARTRRGGGIAGAHGDTDRSFVDAAVDFPERILEILLKVIRQRAKGGDVDAQDGIRQRTGRGIQRVQHAQEGREGLARAGGVGDEDAAARGDQRPCLCLRGSRLSVTAAKPPVDGGGGGLASTLHRTANGLWIKPHVRLVGGRLGIDAVDRLPVLHHVEPVTCDGLDVRRIARQ